MNSSKYFKHNFNAHSDEKLIGVRQELGLEGYGAYFYLLELMGESKDHKLHIEYAKIAYELHYDKDKLQHLVEDFGLFTIEDDCFYSASFVERMESLDELVKIRSEAGRKGGLKRVENLSKNSKTQANACKKSSKSQANACKNSSREDKIIVDIAYQHNKEYRGDIRVNDGIIEERGIVDDNIYLPSEEISDYKQPEKKPSLTLEEKKILFEKHKVKFKEELQAQKLSNGGQYEDEMIDDFFNYWSEPNKSGTQMRMEMEKTWLLAGRLTTWYKRQTQRQYGNGNNQGKYVSPADRAREAYSGITKLSELEIPVF